MTLQRKMSILDRLGEAKEAARKQNEQLSTEAERCRSEYKRLKGVVENLSREYESSKEMDAFRRYKLLKGMIKRTGLHLKLTPDDISAARKKEIILKKMQQLHGMTTHEINQENESMNEQIKENRRKITMITDLIRQMESGYENSKHVMFLQRYRIMKDLIKQLIHNQWI